MFNLLATMEMDYQSLTDEEVMFLVGDTNGTERCANITTFEDLLVECEEEFIVTLAIVPENANIFIDNANTTVSIIDDDGTISIHTIICQTVLKTVIMQRLPFRCQLPLL